MQSLTSAGRSRHILGITDGVFYCQLQAKDSLRAVNKLNHGNVGQESFFPPVQFHRHRLKEMPRCLSVISLVVYLLLNVMLGTSPPQTAPCAATHAATHCAASQCCTPSTEPAQCFAHQCIHPPPCLHRGGASIPPATSAIPSAGAPLTSALKTAEKRRTSERTLHRRCGIKLRNSCCDGVIFACSATLLREWIRRRANHAPAWSAPPPLVAQGLCVR